MNKYLKNLNKVEFVATYACTGNVRIREEADEFLSEKFGEKI